MKLNVREVFGKRGEEEVVGLKELGEGRGGVLGGTWSPASRRRGWLGESCDVTQAPSKWAGK